MPTAGRPRSSALDHVTRQQLDELDALMQRMLALPVNPPEDSPRAPTEHPQAVTPPDNTVAPTALRPATPLESARPIQTEQKKTEAVPGKDHEPGEYVLVKAGASDLSGTAVRAQPTLVVSPHALLRTPQSSVTPSPGHPVTPSLPHPAAVSKEKVRPPRVAWPLRPFLWVNVTFDHGTAWLGPVGRWLRAPGGRALLGWTGVLLLAAAVAWLVLDEMGWTW